MAHRQPPKGAPDARPDRPLVEGDGRGIGPTLGPDVSVEAERREIERGVYERRTHRDQPAEAAGARSARHPIASKAAAAGQDLVRQPGAPTSEGPAAENEQAGARLAHARGQAGKAGAAPDPTRGQGRRGSINDTQGS